jgi:hypothetical protein
MSNRLRTLRPRLLARLQEVTQQEALDAYRAKLAALAPERDGLELELAETYQDAVSKLVDVFARVRAFKQRAQQQLGDPPPNCPVLQPIKGMRVLDGCVLVDFAHPDRTVWPQPSNFASTFVQSMSFDAIGSAWCDPAVQARRRADLASNASFHAQAAKAQEDRLNREERQRFQKGAN